MNKIAILLGVCISFMVLALGLLGGIWWVLTIWEAEMYIAGYLSGLQGLTAWVAGLVAGFKANRLPWNHGAVAGGIYAFLLFILGWILAPSLISSASLFKSLFVCTFFGSLGGVVGLNLRRARQRRKRQAFSLQKF